ncbi:MauE/DoxX family redox-associated membrane protein [Geothrix sp. 21YS21S-4]|uniref:MauE/DoxX family redox-associated membrane protein n=1 Tax=Geothrix sp. 21YS21S-4 TaxID=3068889 RepID=UPI0027BA37FB|nr:MauE/DoxX family redox-associated membrane protein [Geothrix sp. 21YS21S-4]
MRRWVLHPRVTLAARVILGLVFIAAAVPKIGDPPGFAKSIWAYQLVPAALLNPLALILPWLELLCGLALLAGIWLRAAALWTGALLLVFCAALGVNLARHRPVDCGCFGASAPKTEAQRLADMRWVLLRDAALLLLVAQVWTASRKAERPGAGDPR